MTFVCETIRFQEANLGTRLRIVSSTSGPYLQAETSGGISDLEEFYDDQEVDHGVRHHDDG